MGSAKGIVDVDLAERGKLSGKFWIVLLFFVVEAQIFQQQDMRGLQGFGHGFDLWSNTIGCHLHRFTQ